MIEEYESTLTMTLKKRKSYLGLIPSVDFFSEAYELFLTHATPEELDENIITKETHQKITIELGWG